MPSDKSAIQLSDSIAELVLTVVGSVLLILLCLGKLPIAFVVQSGDMQIRTFFSSQFLMDCVPVIVIMTLFSICECVVKIKQLRWTSLVCDVVISSSIVNMVITIYLITRPDLLSADFSAFLEGVDWSNVGLVLNFLQNGGINPILMLICVVIATVSLAECGQAIYKTLKNKSK